MDQAVLRDFIKAEATRLGFAACGIAQARAVAPEAARTIQHWIDLGYEADMSYMQRNMEKRLDPTLLVDGCKSLIVVALNYYPEHPLSQEGYQIAYYAYGADYHYVVKQKLQQLLTAIQTQTPVNGRAFCDTAPLLERYWAVQAGLGFIGLNRLLIIPHAGSFFFLGILAVDIDLPYDTPLNTTCGACRRCLEACPTHALTTEGIDCRKCLSYLTIEHRGPLPSHIGQVLGNRIYGCDNCQRVCPHNRVAIPTHEEAFKPSEALVQMTPASWHTLTKEQYKKLFKHSAIERAGYDGLRRNIEAVENNHR